MINHKTQYAVQGSMLRIAFPLRFLLSISCFTHFIRVGLSESSVFSIYYVILTNAKSE
jgi:hypothetical protein